MTETFASSLPDLYKVPLTLRILMSKEKGSSSPLGPTAGDASIIALLAGLPTWRLFWSDFPKGRGTSSLSFASCHCAGEILLMPLMALLSCSRHTSSLHQERVPG